MAPADQQAPGAPAAPENHVLILFGATGDLAKRKLLPALYHLFAAGLMPAGFRIVGSAPPDGAPDEAAFRAFVRDSLEHFGRRELTDERWAAFAPTLRFATATSDDPGTLVEAVEAAERELGGDPQRLVYLSVPPSAFGPIVDLLGSSGLSERAKLMIEKPFGTDLDSARALDAKLHSVLDEQQIFRIDHFLGKEAAQNILAFRFANGLFEPVWNREHIDYIQLDVPEQLTIEGRGGFYEATGAFRDMVVTHLFQLLGFVAMEPPLRIDARSLRDEKYKLFEAITPLDPERVVYGQYDGYRSEPQVAPDSVVETFTALEVEIDNWRWKGVPFYLRTGKALAQSRHTVTLGFKDPPLRMFDATRDVAAGMPANEISFELAEPGTISIHFLAKEPGARMDLGPAMLSFEYGDAFAVAHELEAYERLLHDGMLGDHMLFTRADAIERAWMVAAPLLARPPRPLPYAQGSWGPEAVDALVAPHRWHLPDRAHARGNG